MNKNIPRSQEPNLDPVYLASDAVKSLIQTLPAGTGYFIAIAVIVMMSGRLVECKGSLARAVLPLVANIKWGWHRVERAMARGTFSLDNMFDRMLEWCIANLPVEPVRLGTQQREIWPIDSSTIARLRAGERLGHAEKGYWQRAGRAVRANVVAAATQVVFICGVRVGLVRRIRFGTSCETSVAAVFEALPKISNRRLIVVDAGIATKEQFAAATDHDALLGRLRINTKLRTAPGARKGDVGRFPLHGEVLHPGSKKPEVNPDEDFEIDGEKGKIRIRRWNNLHYQEHAKVILDVVRVDDPAYPKRPLLIATQARELNTEEIRQGYKHRWPVETNFFVGQDTTAMEMPRAWTALAIERRIGLALLTGSLLKAIAAVCQPLAIGPWDRNPQRSAGRLAYHLGIHITNFLHFALNGVNLRNYNKINQPSILNNLQEDLAA
mgnify:CR=1 FL=1